MTNKIRLLDIKQALLDSRFREKLPEHLHPLVEKFLSNPGCACNHTIYQKILAECKDQVKEYFPQKVFEDPAVEAASLAKNRFSVINCHVDELQTKLRELPSGRKQIAIARHEDQVTVVVNELDFVF